MRGFTPAARLGVSSGLSSGTQLAPCSKVPSLTDSSDNSAAETTAHLRLADAVSIMVGIVIGTAIFKTPTLVYQNVDQPWHAAAFWLLGGLISLCGALCYAELATSFPQNGGEYVFLSRAYAPWLGFLFGWALLTAVHSGNVGAMAYAFADYGEKALGLPPGNSAWLAASALAGLTLLNLAGRITGRTVQNLLSAAKILGLLALIAAGLLAPVAQAEGVASVPTRTPSPGLALVFVLYAFGGWNDTAYVAAEVRNRSRNLPRALCLGIAGITAIYLLVDQACLRTLGFQAVQQTYTPAADVVARAVGDWGGRAASVLVMISALGAINAMILTGSRVYGEMSRDLRLFQQHREDAGGNRIPMAAVVAPGLFAGLLILGVGTQYGQQLIDAGLAGIHLPAIPWTQYFGGFETLVAGTAPVFWLFFLLSGISVFILRRRTPDEPDVFRVPWYPLPPLVFCAMCGYMLYSSVLYAQWLSLLGFAPLAPGLLLYWLRRKALR